MGILEIFLIFFAVIIGIIIIKVVGKIIKIVLTVFLVILLIIAAGVFLAGSDYRALKQDYANSTNLFVFVNNGTVTSALRATGFSLANSSTVSKAERVRLQDWYGKSDFESMRADYYRLLIVDEVGYDESHTQIVNLFKENNLKVVELGVKDGNIVVYPNTMFFRILKYVPRPAITLGLIVS
jgi:hypothetical protein